MELEKYELIEMVGVGSYGQVFKAREKSTNRSIAVKLIKKRTNPSENERKEQKKFLKECNIHSSLSHPNIIQMLSSFETIEYIVVVTELAGIDLHRFMSNNKLSEKQVQKLTWNLISALYYLHSHRVLHRDLKPQNILLNNYRKVDEMEAKLCDFGLARKMTSETYLLTSVKGTPLYMAPEVMDEALYDQKADLWSVGCILYEANFGKPPIKTQSFSQLMKWLRNPTIVWPKPIDENSKSFLDGLLKKEPAKRLTWNDILEHSYIKDKLIIVDHNISERPLTEDLTTSQLVRKEKQRDEIILQRGKKMIAEAMSKCNAITKVNAQEQTAKKKQTNVIGDNESISSDDSISAIIQTDLETDVEGPLIKKERVKRIQPPTEVKAVEPVAVVPEPVHMEIPNQNQNFIIQRYADNFAAVEEIAGDREEKDNANLKIGTMLENMERMQLEDESKWCAAKAKQLANVEQRPIASENTNIRNMPSTSYQMNPNTDLMKRKLSQQLENLSIRLATDLSEKVSNENDKDSSKEKAQCSTKAGNVEKTGQENAEAKPEYEDDQSPPIENEEWLAFIRMSMQEIVSGETDSLKQQTLVGMIVAILRNFNASSTVVGSVVQLLSIPFVLPIPSEDIQQIKTVYVQTKLLPNLIFASKIVCMMKNGNPSFSSTLSSSNFAALSSSQEDISFKSMSDLTVDQLKTLGGVYELVCYLIHINENFLTQFCDSMYIIANDLLRHLLSDVVYDSQGMQIVCAIVSILCFVLRETPENAELIESVIFHESVDMISLLQNGNIILRCRLCNFLKMIGRFSCSSLQKAWTTEFKQTLEGLIDDGNAKVKEAAKDAIDELSKLPFYNV